MSDDRLLRLPEVQRYYAPYSKKHIYNLMHEGQFPQRIKIGPQRVAWRESELKAWLREREEGAADG